VSRGTSWRLALRLARRDALRNRGRSILVLVMIALPVLAVTAADVVIQTQDVSGVESLDRRMGAADAQVVVESGGSPVIQFFDPYDGSGTTGEDTADPVPPTADEIADALGGAQLLEMRKGELNVRTDDGVGYIEGTELDLHDPLARGLFDLTAGHLPADPDEVVVNQAMLDQGYEVGDALELTDDGAPAPMIVGVAKAAESRSSPVAVGPIGALGLGARDDEAVPPSWLVGGGPVSWDQVRDVNALGGTVLSRAVVTDPPPASELPDEMQGGWGGADDDMVAVIVLVVVMALLEVVLLAGPAFAVTARRQSRTLALLSATGGTPAQSRRVILGGGVVLGSVAAVIGVVLGIGVAWLLLPVLQHWSNVWFGPFDVPWPHLAGIALFGLASAFLATVVPAWIASRQDVVAVLAGRRADKRPSLRSPILGVVLLGVGIAGSAYGATSSSSGEFAIAASAVVAVLGMILLVPIVVVGVARLAGRMPLSTRYAARDAARHRTRTVPAVAAVAATVAGVVALGIAVTSDEAQNRETYRAELPDGMGSVGAYADEAPVDWTQLRGTVAEKLPDARLTEVHGLIENSGDEGPSYWLELKVRGTDEPDRLLDSYGSSWGASTLVGDAALTTLPIDIPAADRAAALRMLHDGGIVAFTDQGVEADELVVALHGWTADSDEESVERRTVPALLVPVALGNAGPQAILSAKVAEELGAPTGVSGLLVSGPITRDQEEAVTEALSAVESSSSFYVERGYQADDDTVVMQLVLAALGGVLMLGGTLTATFLALSDARPDLATLAAVGASPRRRRWVAASYALVIGFVGAVLGAAVGFIPGIAVTYPLTRGYSEVDAHFLDIPWLMILGLVVGLPLLTAAIVGLCARSRLPLVARLD
jgi:putative ABC transport system permease protein